MASKSCELDVLPTEMLNEVIKPLLPVLTKIISLSLVEGVFVEEWKVAIICPLHKDARTGSDKQNLQAS